MNPLDFLPKTEGKQGEIRKQGQKERQKERNKSKRRKKGKENSMTERVKEKKEGKTQTERKDKKERLCHTRNVIYFCIHMLAIQITYAICVQNCRVNLEC